MRYIAIIGVLFTVTAAVMMLRHPGERRPTPILKASQFAEPEEIGAVLFRRLWNEVHQAPVVIFGSSRDVLHYDRVWRAFLAVAKQYNVEFFHVYKGENLAPLVDGEENLNLAKIKNELSLQKPVIIHVESSSAAWELVKDIHPQALVLFMTNLPLDQDEDKIIQRECENIKVFNIRCLSANVLTSRQRKKLDSRMTIAAVEKLFDRLHLIYVHEAKK